MIHLHNPGYGSRSKCRTCRGVTLIELLVALALCGIVLAAAGTMLLQSFTNEMAYREQNAVQADARAAVDALTDDLRGAKFTVDASGNKVTTLVVPGTISVTTPLYFNLDDDSGTTKRVRYWRSGTNLLREIDTALTRVNGVDGVVVARYVSNFATPVYAGNAVSVAVTSSTGTAPSQSSVTVRADVILRNSP